MTLNPTDISWQFARLADIDVLTFHDVAKLRVDVFVVEQACIYPEFDGIDARDDTWHIMGKYQQQTIAYARVMGPQEAPADQSVHIGRVLVAPDYRGRGVARVLFQQAMEQAAQQWPAHDVALSAQVQVTGFYESFDFKKVSEVYMEDGIPHVDMVRKT